VAGGGHGQGVPRLFAASSPKRYGRAKGPRFTGGVTGRAGTNPGPCVEARPSRIFPQYGKSHHSGTSMDCGQGVAAADPRTPRILIQENLMKEGLSGGPGGGRGERGGTTIEKKKKASRFSDNPIFLSVGRWRSTKKSFQGGWDLSRADLERRRVGGRLARGWLVQSAK